MRQPRVDDFVRLKADIPELELTRGQVGVVRAAKFSKNKAKRALAYEVEFHSIGHDCQLRTLLQPEQIQVHESSAK